MYSYALVLNLTTVIMVFFAYIMLLLLHLFVEDYKSISGFFLFCIGFVVLVSNWNFIIALSMCIIGIFALFRGD